MIHHSQKFILLTLFLFLSGCVSSEMTRLGSKTYQPRPDDHLVEVFVSTSAPVQIQNGISNIKRPLELPSRAKKIGRIDTNGAPAAPWSKVVSDAKSHAREIGGDGIEIIKWGSPVTGFGPYGTAQHGKVISCNVYRYR